MVFDCFMFSPQQLSSYLRNSALEIFTTEDGELPYRKAAILSAEFISEIRCAMAKETRDVLCE